MAEAGVSAAGAAAQAASAKRRRVRSDGPQSRPDRSAGTRKADAARARRRVEQLRRSALELEKDFAAVIRQSHPEQRDGLRNLLHYLAVRQHDIRPLQHNLATLGVSSLGRMEAHAMASMNAVAEVLDLYCGNTAGSEPVPAPPFSIRDGGHALEQKAAGVLGPVPSGNRTRIMVTMPGEAAQDPVLIRSLLQHGMSIMRINCAHDAPAQWLKMVRHLRRAERELGLKCLISFDLGGPKLRTGPITPGPRVIKWRPKRDLSGRVTAPARVRLCATPSESGAGETLVPLAGLLATRARTGDCIHLVDAHGRERMLRVIKAAGASCLCEAGSTAYVIPGTQLELRRNKRVVLRDAVGDVPALPQAIRLRAGDDLDIFRGDAPGHPAVLDTDGRVTTPAAVGCALPEVFQSVRRGQRVFLDDGCIAGVIRSAGPDRIRVRIDSAVGGTAKLRDEKGINLPDTELNLPALTAKDKADLAFVARHGDIVALSFVQRPRDIDELLAELRRHKATRLGIMLKIETSPAFSELPSLLISAMRCPKVAVMVARGDLGVEVGFDRLSEVQEEILWLCEAAHVPVIWATQVLESLAKGGMPSRAEVTDAAMSSRAECVMLNKGPYILETLKFLRNVLTRMAGHQRKKTPLLRKLNVSELRPAAGSTRGRTRKRNPRAGSP